MPPPLHHPRESSSNDTRDRIASVEPRSSRTYTPTQAVLSKSAGVFHWTPEGRRLFDFSSGVLVANLGHNSSSWMARFTDYMGWRAAGKDVANGQPAEYFSALPMTAYNA